MVSRSDFQKDARMAEQWAGKTEPRRVGPTVARLVDQKVGSLAGEMARMWAENWDTKMAETKVARMACCSVETSDETTGVQWGMT
jgi:hypothetical protein